MEIVFLILFVLGAMFLTGRSSGRGHRGKRRTHQTSGARRNRNRTPQPFDAESAKPLPATKTLRGTAYIVDGDTVRIQGTQIRLFGVDAPEIDHPYGKKAKWALVSICKGRRVNAEILEQDAHGRAVAICHLDDGRDLSAEMVKLGLAIDWPKYSGGKYRSLETADARRKLWLADARQKGGMHVWEKFEATKHSRQSSA